MALDRCCDVRCTRKLRRPFEESRNACESADAPSLRQDVAEESLYHDSGNGDHMVQAIFTVVGAALFCLRRTCRSIKAPWHWLMNRRMQQSPSLAKNIWDAVGAESCGAHAYGGHGPRVATLRKFVQPARGPSRLATDPRTDLTNSYSPGERSRAQTRLPWRWADVWAA